MIKKIFSLGLLCITLLSAYAQQPQMQLPLNKDVKHGTLPNGMQYFILHNSEPKGRANFYIAQKVGSTLETPDQLGLAHFLEHMAFNGTKNYPGKNMLNYLQSKGIRFGADINAYTSFDETGYNIDNVPTSDQALMDSVLLVLHDWSCDILLEEDEINAERGVIEEEWRRSNDAQHRMFESVLPKLYKEYQYQQMPIGKMEVVRNFKPETLRAYYKKWYRPDQQGLVIVGDFDAAEMEQKVKTLFSGIVMPKNAAERTYPVVSDNKEPLFIYYDDPELQMPRLDFSIKFDKTPFEMRNTLMNFVSTSMVERLIAEMINNRLQEYRTNPDCKYIGAGVNFGDYWISNTKAAFNIVVVAKSDITVASKEAIAIVARALKAGFSESELKRAVDNMMSGYEKAYNERSKTSTSSLAKGLIRHFIDNSPNMGIEQTYELVKQILPAITVGQLNQISKEILKSDNQVFLVSQPRKDEFKVVKEEEFVPAVEATINDKYEAYVDEVITEPLIRKAPKGGKIKSQKAGEYGTQEFTLSNGVKVVVKPTDFKADEVVMMAFREGGKRAYNSSQAVEVNFAVDVAQLAKFGSFDMTKLQKYLAGKNVGLSFGVKNVTDVIDGYSTVKDLPTLMELLYTSFTDLNPDKEKFMSLMEQFASSLKNKDKDPEFIFDKHCKNSSYGNNPMFAPIDMEMLSKFDYDKTFKFIKEAQKNAADYTFLFVGNVDINKFKPLMEKYIASLPASKAKRKVAAQSSIAYAEGIVNDEFKQPMESPVAKVYNIISGNDIEFTPVNANMMSLMGSVLQMIFTETLREEEGGTYSPAAGAAMNANTNQWFIQYMYDTNGEKLSTLNKRADSELKKLVANGASAAHFAKAKAAMLKQLEVKERTNEYWSNQLLAKLRGYDYITDAKENIEKITLDDLNKFMKRLNVEKNRINVVMDGVAIQK